MVEGTEYLGGGYATSGLGASGPPAVSLREQVEELTEQAREETVRLAADARAQVAALVRRRQELLADRLGGIAAALRDAGRRLQREAARPARVDAATRGVCELTERAARQVDRASRYVRRSELRDVVRDLEELARRRPAVLVGGSFATGMLLARFLKSSSERARWPGSDLPSMPASQGDATAGYGRVPEELPGRW